MIARCPAPGQSRRKLACFGCLIQPCALLSLPQGAIALVRNEPFQLQHDSHSVQCATTPSTPAIIDQQPSSRYSIRWPMEPSYLLNIRCFRAVDSCSRHAMPHQEPQSTRHSKALFRPNACRRHPCNNAGGTRPMLSRCCNCTCAEHARRLNTYACVSCAF
jgi:hypothetical protein